ncbi:MAG: arylsulfatase [Planctomyces sp.]|nr:arylsulfatase [Planctomyces sp.]
MQFVRVTGVLLIAVVALLVEPGSAKSAERPNIILMMVDDMGFSDLGCYGGEIETPNIDALAAGGVRFDQFYNSGRCCPTRATLMTGLHPHQAGIGHMTLPPGRQPGDRPENYQGYINRQCVTVAEVLRESGYATLMAGKWHLGMHDDNLWPRQRGFDRFYGSIPGATRFFYPEHPRGMTLDNTPLENPESTTDEAFYTTDAFTDYAIQFVDEQHAAHADQPFFLYLAYTAPHWPLQAFEDDIDKYRDTYEDGWDALRNSRYQRQIELGLINPDWKLSPTAEGVPDWKSLQPNKRAEMALKMAVYAAMIDRIDQNVGRLVDYLKKTDQYENTLILFLSDNGACAEGGMLGRGEFIDVEQRNQQPSNAYGEAWANASSTPFRLYKHFAHEGGAATPFFMHWPKQIQPQSSWYREPAQLIDIMPTLIDVAGASYPEQAFGNEIPPLDGVSLRPAFAGKPLKRGEPIFIEHENNAFVRDGRWKLVGRNVSPAEGVVPERWELYDMQQDRTELHNLADEKADLRDRMADAWDQWAKRVGVYPKPGKKVKH